MIVRIVVILVFALLAEAEINAQTSPYPTQAAAGLFWPVDQSCETSAHAINGTLGELRSLVLNPGTSAISLHGSVDIAAPENTPIFAVETGFAGAVQYPDSSRKGIRIGRFAYLHLKDINPQLLLLRQQSQSIPQGMLIGHTNALNHVHFVQGGPLDSGFPVQNPLTQLFNYQDTAPPSIPDNIQLVDQASNVFPLAGTDFFLDTPQVNILATDADAQSLGSQTVGLFKVGYRVQAVSTGNSYDSGEIFPTVFDQFDQNAQVSLVYNTASADSYRYRVTNSPTAAAFFDTTQLPPGRYQFMVIAEDTAGNREQNAVYGVTPVVLSITTSGSASGTVTSVPNGISNCSGICNAIFAYGTSVTLTAAPASSFMGWTGDCGGTNPTIAVTVSANAHCVATFSSTRSVQITSLTCSLVGMPQRVVLEVHGSVTEPNINTYMDFSPGATGGSPGNNLDCGLWMHVGANACRRLSGQPSSTTWSVTFITFLTQFQNDGFEVFLTPDFSGTKLASASSPVECH